MCGRATPLASITPVKSPPRRNAARRDHRWSPSPACYGSAEPHRVGTGSAAMRCAGNAGAGRRGCRGLARQTNNHSPAVHPHPIDVYLRGGNNGGKTGRNHFFSFLFFPFFLAGCSQASRNLRGKISRSVGCFQRAAVKHRCRLCLQGSLGFGAGKNEELGFGFAPSQLQVEEIQGGRLCR